MEQAIQTEIYGIKCDTVDCDFREDTVKVEDYPEWLNKPCEKCGGNLLTQEDYDAVQMMLEITKMFNSKLPPRKPNEKLAAVKVEMNGTGNINMTMEEIEKE